MATCYDTITDELASWIARQHIFFVATAPLGEDGLVNCSPKGLDTFRIVGPREVAYVDLTGSGIETIAHARENGRIVLMFCAFEGPPRIVRFHGRSDVLLPGSPDFDLIAQRFPPQPGCRAIVRARLERVSDSCGFGVPRYDYVGERDTLARWAESKGPDGLARYRDTKNRHSLDGLPGLMPTATSTQGTASE